MDAALTSLIAVLTLLLGYLLRGLEQRRARLQAWDETKRGIYGRYLVDLDELRSAATQLPLMEESRDNPPPNLEGEDLFNWYKKWGEEIAEMRGKVTELHQEMKRLEAEMHILSPQMVWITGSVTRRLLQIEPDHDDWHKYRRQFIDRARLDLGLEKAPNRLRRRAEALWSKVAWWKHDRVADAGDSDEGE